MLLENILSVSQNLNEIKVGLEATGHYSYNILGFPLNNNLNIYVINPLYTSLYRKLLIVLVKKYLRYNKSSCGKLSLEKVQLIYYEAKSSIGSIMPAKSLELKHTIKLIRELDSEIDEIETEINKIMDEIQSPIIPYIFTYTISTNDRKCFLKIE